MPDPLDVLFVGHGAERSGPPIFLAHLQTWLAASTDLTSAVFVARGGPLLDEYRRHGPVRVRDRGITPSHLAQRALQRLGRTQSAARLEVGRTRAAARSIGRPRLVYVNTVAPQSASLARAVVGGDTKLVVHVHEMNSTLRHRIDPDDLTWLLGRADGVIAASEAVRLQLVAGFGLATEDIAVCHEFVEPITAPTAEGRRAVRRRLGLPEGGFVVTGSGRLDWRKAPELLAQALWRVRSERPDLDARVLWIGAGGDDRWQLEHDLETMGLADTFMLVGEQADPSEFVQAADVFALSSREDAFPLACLEAAGAEVPLVTFDTGGMVEFIGRSDGGIVVPYPDTAGFSRALIGLADDEHRRHAMGKAAAAHVRAHHTVGAGAPNILAELRAVLDPPPSP